MLRDIKRAFEEVGLTLNASKCKVQTNAHTNRTPQFLEIDGMLLPIVPLWEDFKVLGVQFTLVDGVVAELDARVAAAWGIFYKIWPLLRRRGTSLAKRLRLFETNVSKSMMWACESWTLTVKDKQRLQSVERAMLRRFAGPRRNSTEDYIPWLSRATHAAEQARNSVGIKSWTDSVAAKRWSWAGHVARMYAQRWASRLTKWRGSDWWKGQDHDTNSGRPLRARAGHFRRWENELVKFATHIGWNSWWQTAQTMTTPSWNNYCADFIAFANRSVTRGTA
jgi:hypothetical protein